MLILGLTGGIACGKSTVAAMLKDCGASIIDADQISRSLTAENGEALPAIRQAFGGGVFHPDGTLDRPALSKAVFGNAEALAKLNAITHPLIRQEMERRMDDCRKAGCEVVILDVPLLFEANMQHMADLTACAYCGEETQIARMKARNAFDRETALSRIRSQMPVREKAALCDVIIDTDRPLSALQEAVHKLYQGWLAHARKENE